MGEIAVAGALAERGYTILGQQVYVRVPAGLRITDFLVTGGNAGRTLAGFEVKVNSSVRSSLQILKDNQIATTGGIVASRGGIPGAGLSYGDPIKYKTYEMFIDNR